MASVIASHMVVSPLKTLPSSTMKHWPKSSVLQNWHHYITRLMRWGSQFFVSYYPKHLPSQFLTLLFIRRWLSLLLFILYPGAITQSWEFGVTVFMVPATNTSVPRWLKSWASRSAHCASYVVILVMAAASVLSRAENR